MNLFDFANKADIVPTLSGNAVRDTPFWNRAYKEIGNESRTDPTVAAIMSQIALETPAFDEALVRNGLDPDFHDSRECMVLTRQTWGEYVVLVADDYAEPFLKPRRRRLACSRDVSTFRRSY